MLTGAFVTAERCGFGRALGAWLADLLLAQRLGWAHAVPLLGAEMGAGIGASGPRRSGFAAAAARIEDESGQAKNLLVAAARAAVRAIDLGTELERAESCSPLRQNSRRREPTRLSKGFCPAMRWSRLPPSAA